MEVDYVFKKLKEQEAHAAINPMSEHEAHHHKKACSCCTAHQKEDWFLCQKNITELNREETPASRNRADTGLLFKQYACVLCYAAAPFG